jgi:hypothetical protein
MFTRANLAVGFRRRPRSPASPLPEAPHRRVPASRRPHPAHMPDESIARPAVRAPEFPDGLDWINAAPLALADLRGRAVLLDFWTYG